MITPVLLCGGSGTRLWPLSRQSYPKQFAPLLGSESLFQASAQRLAGQGFAAPVVLTNSDFRFIVTEQLATIGIDPGAILIEPSARNTAPPVLAAALYLYAQDAEALMLVAPSDHVVPDGSGFRTAIATGVEAAQAGQIVTFGITPTHAETGYGYLELDGSGAVIPLKRFVEKPEAAQAEQMLASGRYLWNAGIFLCRAKTIIQAFQKHAPELMGPVGLAMADAAVDLGFLRLNPTAWEGAPDISLDYAVMEQAENIAVVPYTGAWSDLGGWNAVWGESDPGADGVATHGAAHALECQNTLLRSEHEGLALVGLGLDNIIAIAMPDAVLVADRSRAQDVKTVVTHLKETGVRQATEFPRDHRPWGWFDQLAMGERFQVKRIVVHPGAALSLQSHQHRAEHWIVVAGTAQVTIGDDVTLVGENQSVYIPIGALHRLENIGKIPMILIEVQTGSYLGEDDITRYEDLYARSPED